MRASSVTKKVTASGLVSSGPFSLRPSTRPGKFSTLLSRAFTLYQLFNLQVLQSTKAMVLQVRQAENMSSSQFSLTPKP